MRSLRAFWSNGVHTWDSWHWTSNSHRSPLATYKRVLQANCGLHLLLLRLLRGTQGERQPTTDRRQTVSAPRPRALWPRQDTASHIDTRQAQAPVLASDSDIRVFCAFPPLTGRLDCFAPPRYQGANLQRSSRFWTLPSSVASFILLS